MTTAIQDKMNANAGIEQGGNVLFLKSGGTLEVDGVDKTHVVRPASRLVAAGSAKTLTAADDGKTILLDTAAGSTVTLPDATGSGFKCRFVISTTATSNSHVIKVANASDTMKGVLHGVSDDPATVKGWIAGASDDTITFNRTTTGLAAVGHYVEVEDIADNVWAVRGMFAQSGTEATPFSATVS